MKNLTKETFMYVLGGFVVLMATAVVILTLILPIPEASHDIVIFAIGQLMGMALAVVGYFYGSSKSSSDKNELLAQAQPITSTSTQYPDGAAVKVDEFPKPEVKP